MTEKAIQHAVKRATEIRLTIPIVHVCPENRRHGPKGRGHIGTTKRWRSSLEVIGLYALQACREYGHRKPWTGAVELEAHVIYPEDRRKRADLGAYWKAIGDGLEGTVYEDDAQIIRAIWRCADSDGSGWIDVRVRDLSIADS